VFDLPPISSIQCVDALWRLGFEIDDVDDRRVRLLRRDGRRVFVARHKTIEPNELRVILLVAGVEDQAFVEVLQRRSKSGEISRPDHASAADTSRRPR
jgi:hypothetical protein